MCQVRFHRRSLPNIVATLVEELGPTWFLQGNLLHRGRAQLHPLLLRECLLLASTMLCEVLRNHRLLSSAQW